MITGTTTSGTHAPLVNLVAATMIRTIRVANDPMPFTTTPRRHPRSRRRRWWTTMPACDSVNDVNTPTAYRGIRALVRPPKAMSRPLAASARNTMPLENTRRSPRLANWRGR